ARLGKNLLKRSSHTQKTIKNLALESPAERSLSWNRFIDDDLKKEIYSAHLKKHIGSESTSLGQYTEQIRDYPELNKNLYVEFKTWLPDDALFKVDKMTMMNSLEARVPFLDHKIVELAASLPIKHKLNGWETKHILKKAMQDRLPKNIIYRKKHGFNLPTSEWFRKELKDYAEEVIFDKELEKYLNMKKVRKLFDYHLEKKEDFRYQLNTLLSFGLWHRCFIVEY
ncbi:MAG: asparagine synthase C-terminal domain-containing protein, partial [Nanoarchaeota archaeon]|nr:asparagine synthase C-terminal domain-containing protein [Nanoarchaeota archaeon]